MQGYFADRVFRL